MSMFSGLITAIITPFCDGVFDAISFKRLLAEQEVADGIVIGGTTGESPTITFEELRQAIVCAQDFPKKRIVGVGSNNTLETIEKITMLDQMTGIDAYLVIAPYYNRPSDLGIFEHYSAIAESTRRPIILYSNPIRCGVEISVDTVVRLAEENKNIVGIKEATNCCSRVDDLYRSLPEDFAIFSGNDNMTFPFMALGACGVMSAASNVLVREIKRLVDETKAGKLAEARALHRTLIPKMRLLFEEPNPIVIKYVLASQRILRSAEVRLPLYVDAEEHLEEIATAFHH